MMQINGTLIKRMLEKFDNLVNILENFFVTIAGIILSLVVGVILYTVLGRVFHYPTGWTFEIIEYSIVYITFFSISWVLRIDSHVQVDLVTNNVSEEKKKILMYIIYSLISIVSIVFFFSALNEVINSFQQKVYMQTVLRPPKFLVLFPLPVGFFLLFFRGLIKVSKLDYIK